MKRFSTLFFIFFPFLSFAQVSQRGVVKEYNDAKKKPPLSGVEIVVSNAGSNVSGRDGSFLLSFRALKPGDRVDVRKIEKAGYEIFNKDALDEWRIANDNSEFTIVLCKSSKFKALKDQYNAIASKSYAQQQKKDEERLANLLKEGKLQQAEYDRKLKELKEKYDEQLENLDNYIDRFARIDLQTISKDEQKIIEMVKAGKIEEAIAAYEAMNLEDKYAQAVENIGIANNAISQLEKVRSDNENARKEAYAAVRRMNEARRLQGGEDNYSKIGWSLAYIIKADTSSLTPLYDYAIYLSEQRRPLEACECYDIILRHEDNIVNRAVCLQRYSNACVQEDPLKSEKMALEALELFNDLFSNGDTSERVANGLLYTYNSLGNVYSFLNQPDLSQKYYELFIEQRRFIGFKDEASYSSFTKVLHNLAFLLMNQGEYDKSRSLLDEAYGIQKTLNKSVEDKQILYNILVQLGTACGKVGNLSDSKIYFNEAEDIIKELILFNPKAFKQEAILLYNQIGVIFIDRNPEEAVRAYKNACEYAEEEYNAINSLKNKLYYYVVLGGLSMATANMTGHEAEGLDLNRRALIGMEELYAVNNDIFRPYYNISLIQESNILIACNRYSEALIYIEKALNLISDNAATWDTKGEILLKLGDLNGAVTCWEKVMELDKNFLKSSISKLHDGLYEKGLISE